MNRIESVKILSPNNYDKLLNSYISTVALDLIECEIIIKIKPQKWGLIFMLSGGSFVV